MAKPTATKTPTTTTTPKPAPAPSAKAPASGVTATKAPVTLAATKAAPLTAKASTGCCGGHTSCAPKYEQIAQRAYEVWVAKGRPQGQDIENWKQAEVELSRGTLVNAA